MTQRLWEEKSSFFPREELTPLGGWTQGVMVSAGRREPLGTGRLAALAPHHPSLPPHGWMEPRVEGSKGHSKVFKV